MADTYTVPPILARIRVLRSRKESTMAELPPSTLWFRCEEELPGEDNGIVRALYLHAMIEIGYLLDGPDGSPYVVCPVCGVHLGD